MRIALITPGFSSSPEDWCIPALRNLVQELAGRHAVEVFTLRYPHRRGEYDVFGAHVHAFGGAGTAGAGRFALLARALWRIVASGRLRRFDVIHGLWADEPGFLAVRASRLLGVPAVVSLMGGELVGERDIGYGTQLSHVGRRLVIHALGRASCVTAGSVFLQQSAASYVRSGPVHRLPIGVDTALFHPGTGDASAETRLDGEIKLLHVASLSPVKDQPMLLRALACVVADAPGIHLHIVGDGPMRPELARLAAELGIAGHVNFHGDVRHDRLPAFYRAADLCILTSRHESQSLVVLEAGACGRTTVGTAVGLLPELAPATRTVPVGDAAALAAIILDLVRQPALIGVLGEACRASVEENYTLNRTIASLTRLYDEARAIRGSSPS